MSKNVKMTNPMKVITGPNTRWSYANVWEPKSINGGTPKYSVSLIIPKPTQRLLQRLKPLSRLHTVKVRQSSRAMVSPYLLFPYLKRHFVMEILKDRMILHTLAATL